MYTCTIELFFHHFRPHLFYFHNCMDAYCVFLICAFQHQSDPKTCKCATLWWNLLLPTTGPVNKCKSMLWQIRRERLWRYCGLMNAHKALLWGFFSIHLAWNSVNFSLSPSNAPLPMSSSKVECVPQRDKGGNVLIFKKKLKAKPKRWKMEKKSCMRWWNQVSMNESKQAVAPHNSHIWCCVHKLEKKK